MTTEWITPKAYIYLARQVLGEIDLDPASSDVAQRSVQAGTFYCPDVDGLSKPWFGRVWLSPPQGRGSMSAWVTKLLDEFGRGCVTEAVILTPNSTDAAWFRLLFAASQVCVLKKGRIRFESEAAKAGTPAQGQCFFYLGGRPEVFRSIFGPLGFCMSADYSRAA